MEIKCLNFENNSVIPPKYTADGINICPDFEISNVPENTDSLAIICHDPDATSGVPWVHWLVWGLPANTKNIFAGQLPEGATEAINSFGLRGYGGPSPSPGSGKHRYVFTLFAIHSPVKLSNDLQHSYEDARSALESIALSKSSWTGIYERV